MKLNLRPLVSRLVAMSVGAGFALLASQPASAADILYNGGFELPGMPFGTTFHVWPGDTVGGWTALGGDGSHYLDTAYAGQGVQWPGAYEGSDYLFLNSAGLNGISIVQSISLAAGQTYHLSFAMAGLIGRDSTAFQPAVTVQVGGSTNSFAGTAGTAWHTFGFDFTPVSGGSTTLKFTSNASLTDLGTSVVMLDGISIHAVPEPATVALMLAGLGGIVVAVRGRRAG